MICDRVTQSVSRECQPSPDITDIEMISRDADVSLPTASVAVTRQESNEERADSVSDVIKTSPSVTDDIRVRTSLKMFSVIGPFHNLCARAHNCFHRAKMIGVL